MHRMPALQLFGAGREKRLYAVPPYTLVESLAFEDHPFEVQRWDHACALCGASDSFLDEVIVDDAGRRLYVCSDSDHCQTRQQAGHTGGPEDAGRPQGQRRSVSHDWTCLESILRAPP
jgi:alpha-D-ribose 1-methylphosphonate 5-phosphate C-P lyase